MKIYEISVIGKNTLRKNLSYFSSQKLEKGDVIDLKIRGKKTKGVVVSLGEINRSKTNLRKSNFILKKIPKTKVSKTFSESFLKASEDSANFFVGSVGQVIDQYTNKLIFEKNYPAIEKNRIAKFEQTILMISFDERLEEYKKIIRSYFAKNKSIFICLPNYFHINFLIKKLKLEKDERVISLHAKLSKKVLLENIEKITNSQKPVLILATDSFLSVFRKDMGLYVLEKENFNTKKITKPYTETLFFIKRLAYHSGNKIIFADHFPTMGTYLGFREGKIYEEIPKKNRFATQNKINLIDMVNETENIDPKEKISIISTPLLKLVDAAMESEKNLAILVGRKGLATNTVCRDCGKVVSCKECHKPLVLVSEKNKNFFKCFKCNLKTSTKIYCENCGGWNLKPLGIGVEKIAQEIRRLRPNAKIKIFDKESVKTASQIERVVTDLYKNPGNILIGTEMMFRYLTEPVGYGAIGSIDNMFSLPDYRVQEKIFKLITSTLKLSEGNLLIQSRRPEEPIFGLIQTGLISKFYDNELAIRKRLQYPPFSIIIKASLSGPRAETIKDIENLAEVTSAWGPRVIGGYQKSTKDRYLAQCFFKVNHRKWPDPKLFQILISLPTRYSIEVSTE